MNTDNIKALAKHHRIERAAIREMARDIGLAVAYSEHRRTYVIDEAPVTVRHFCEHLSEMVVSR